MKLLSGYLACIFFLAINLSAQDLQINKPNIVLILVDDLGYSDVGYMKQKSGILTPNIDQLAGGGMVFTNAYASCPVCSPTRASLLTGKYPATLKLTCHIPGMGMEKYHEKLNKGKKLKEAYFMDHLPLEEVTIAEVLKEQGYTCGFIGKWHLAGEGSIYTSDGIVDARYQPENQGFDVNIGGCAYGQPKSYFDPYKNGTIEDRKEGEYLTDRLGDEAVKFISENKDRPFFLDLSTYAVHTPLRAPAETIEKYGGNTYFAMIEKLDQNVGKVMKQLKALDLLENTLVIFYSDNGGLWGNPPLRDKKGSLYEGGIRVPLIFNWPGKIEAGKSCSVPVTTVDFFPTLLELAGLSPTPYLQLEGLSLVPLFEGQMEFPKRSLYWHFPHHRNNKLSMAAAVREGDWKLVKEFESEELFLFNLKEDLGEENNRISENPEIGKLLLANLDNWLLETDAEMPELNTETIMENKFKKGSFGFDVQFFQNQNIEAIELKSETSGARILVVPDYQGRVMTSSANGPGGKSFGWINHEYIQAGKINSKFNPFGGEERFWLGPEGGPSSIFFNNGEEQSFTNWRVPGEIDTVPFDLIDKDETTCSFQKDFKLKNASGTPMDIGLERSVKLLSKSELEDALDISIHDSLHTVAYETDNVLINKGENAWTEEKGFLSIWLLCMFNPSEKGIVFLPYTEGSDKELGKIVEDDYFGKVPSDRLVAKNGCVFFKVDGKLRGKIGLSPERARAFCGSYDPVNSVLTILWYSKPEKLQKYVNSKWGEQTDPLKGDAVNAYNDGPVEDGSVMGPFYEIESSSPAALLNPGESLKHTQRIFHIAGDEKYLNEITQRIFNISLEEVNSIF